MNVKIIEKKESFRLLYVFYLRTQSASDDSHHNFLLFIIIAFAIYWMNASCSCIVCYSIFYKPSRLLINVNSLAVLTYASVHTKMTCCFVNRFKYGKFHALLMLSIDLTLLFLFSVKKSDNSYAYIIGFLLSICLSIHTFCIVDSFFKPKCFHYLRTHDVW